MNTHGLPSIGIATCLGVMTLMGGGSCDHSRSSTTAPPVSTSRQDLDEAVIEAALVDLITSSDTQSETLRREQGEGKVLLSIKSRDVVGTLRQELRSAESEEWKSLKSTDRAAAREAAADVIQRLETKQFFAAFRPKDPRILLSEDDPASTPPAARFKRSVEPRPIRFAPPGYGAQRRIAVVVFSFAWSIHSGDATYVLRFDGNNWHVISRHFAYYL